MAYMYLNLMGMPMVNSWYVRMPLLQFCMKVTMRCFLQNQLYYGDYDARQRGYAGSYSGKVFK